MTQLIQRWVYLCNCGDIFEDRESLIKHIANKKKGKNRAIHYGGDYVSGNRTGLHKPVWYLR